MKIFLLKTSVEVIKLPSKHPTPLIRLKKHFIESLKNSWISAEFKRRYQPPEDHGENSGSKNER